jgi:hypothetical protein
LFACCTEKEIGIYSSHDKKLIQKIQAHDNWIYKVRFSYDDRFLFGVGEKGFFAIYEKI